MKFAARFLALGVVVPLFAACRTPPFEPTSSDLSSTPPRDLTLVADLFTSVDLFQCNDLDASNAPSVGLHEYPMNPPMAVGGQIVDGTYYQTDYVLFGGPHGQVDGGALTTATRLVYRFRKGTYDHAVIWGAAPQFRDSGTFSINNTTMTLAGSCPDKEQHSYQFSASPTQLEILFPGAIVLTLTRQ
jgi:hypothetical protein